MIEKKAVGQIEERQPTLSELENEFREINEHLSELRKQGANSGGSRKIDHQLKAAIRKGVSVYVKTAENSNRGAGFYKLYEKTHYAFGALDTTKL
jgi:hypothetical protein